MYVYDVSKYLFTILLYDFKEVETILFYGFKQVECAWRQFDFNWHIRFWHVMMIKTDDNNHCSANDCHQKVSYDNSEKDMIWVGNRKTKQGWR